MNKVNLTTIGASFIIGIAAVISVLLYRDTELKKLAFQLGRQKKIDDCISSVRTRYSKVAQQGVGILNQNEILVMKNEMNSEEERCIKRY